MAKAPSRTVEVPERWGILTRGAFLLLLALVAARCCMTEIFRDPTPVTPGAGSAPRAAGPATSVLVDLLLCVPAILVLGRRVFDGKYVVRLGWSHLLFGLFAGWAVVSTAWAADRFAAIVNGFHWVAAAAVVFAGSQLVRSWRRIRIVAAVGVGLLLIYGGLGLHKRLVDHPDFVRDWDKRGKAAYMRETGLTEHDFQLVQMDRKIRGGELVGFSTSANTYAAGIVVLAVIGMGVAAQRWVDGRRGVAVALAAAVPVLAFALHHTHSRLAYLTPVLGLFALVALRWIGPWLAAKHRKAFVLGVVAFGLGVAAVAGHGLYHGSLVEQSMTNRWYYWTGAARVVKQRPVLGVGLGNFGLYYPEVRPPLGVEEVADPHNVLVKAFAELGVVGGGLMIALLGVLAWEMTRPNAPVVPAAAEKPTRWLPMALTLAILAAVLNFLFSHDWEQEAAWLVLNLMAAVAGAVLMVVGLAAGALRGLDPAEVDDAAAPWVLRGVLVALGVLFVHNLIDFSLSEPGVLSLFALLVGAVLGLRHPSVAGKSKRTAGAVVALSAAVLAWMVALGLVWLRTALAESAGARGDAMVRAATPGNPAPLEQARVAYTQAMEAQPLNAEYPYRLANVLFLRNDHRTYVEGMIARAIEGNPRAIRYHRLRGQYAASREPVDAEGLRLGYQRALALDPRQVQVRIEYAEALARAGDLDNSAEQLREALRYDEQLPKDEPKRLAPARRRELEERLAGFR